MVEAVTRSVLRELCECVAHPICARSVYVLTITQMGRWVRVLPRRIPVKVQNLLQTVKGKPPSGFPADDFDERTGLETAERVKIYKLDSVNENYVHGQGYAPVSPSALTEALRAIPEDLRKYIFVDLGCGKGRALFLASMLGIRRLIGVEISPTLVRIARENAAKWKSSSSIEIICADASEWAWPEENLIVFLYNPFDGVILTRALANLRKSISEIPKDIWLIYCSASHRECFDRQKWLKETTQTGRSIIYRAVYSQ